MITAKLYARALVDLIYENPERLEDNVNNLRKILTRKGLERKTQEILKDAITVIKHKEEKNSIKIISAKELTDEDVDQILKKTEFGNSRKVTKMKNPNLIGGYIIENNRIEHDKTYKKALLNLFKEIRKTK